MQYVDAAYISAQTLAEAAAEQRELIGPAPAPPNNNDGRFTSEVYQVSVEQRRATCPAGGPNTQCSRLEEQATGKMSYRFELATADAPYAPGSRQRFFRSPVILQGVYSIENVLGAWQSNKSCCPPSIPAESILWVMPFPFSRFLTAEQRSDADKP